MRLLVNGQWRECESATLQALRAEICGDEAVISILDGVACEQDAPLNERSNVIFAPKFGVPDASLLSLMLSARNTPALQNALNSGHVGIAGLGGLGSNIAINLARAGVGHLHLVDFDSVDVTNLNRQYYEISHIGKPKTEALESKFHASRPKFA